MEAKHNGHSWICDSRICDTILEKLGIVHTNYFVLLFLFLCFNVCNEIMYSQPASNEVTFCL